MTKNGMVVSLPQKFLIRVTEHEHSVAINALRELVNNAEIESKFVLALIERMEASIARMEQLSTEPRKHPLSEQIDEKSATLRHQMRAMKSTIDAMAQSKDPEMRKDGRILKYWILNDRKDMVSHAKVRQTKSVKALKDAVAHDSRIMPALEAAGISYMYEHMVEVYDETVALKEARLKSWAETQNMRNGLRQAINNDLGLLLNVIVGFANMENPDQEFFIALSYEIRKLLIGARALHAARMTRNENANSENEDGDNSDHNTENGGHQGDDTVEENNNFKENENE